MNKAGPGKVVVRINSPGGSAFDGLAMYSMLKNHPAGVDTVVDGLAASAASIVAMAGDNVGMHEMASIMMHNSHGLVVGNKHDMKSMVDQLNAMDAKMSTIYSKKSGMAIDAIQSMMDKETWLSSSGAKDLHFIDSVIEPPTRGEAVAAALDSLVIVAKADDADAGKADVPVSTETPSAEPGPAPVAPPTEGVPSDTITPDQKKMSDSLKAEIDVRLMKARGLLASD